ncbi:MAG: DUF58 domain-containing protein [Hyphomicrobiaceae bacterium]
MAKSDRDRAGVGQTEWAYKGMSGLEGEAHALADRLPELVLDAMRISSTVAHGIHGRRRAGPGETFWQFRQLNALDAATSIDWRRSASSDHLYIREREWEAAHTVWLWPDLSASMNFRSHLSAVTKRDRAIVLALAAAELLVMGGERVGLLGLTRPSAARRAANRLAEALVLHGKTGELAQSLPPEVRLARFSGAILISDFLDPVETIAARLRAIAGADVSGHLVQVLDPAEETLPYDGRAEFVGLEDGAHWIADRVESLRERYQAKLAAHREALADVARRLGWTFLVHHTDRPAAEPLLALAMRLRGEVGGQKVAVSGGLAQADQVAVQNVSPRDGVA